MKKSLYFGIKQWRRELKNLDFWIVILCAFAFLAVFFYDSGSNLYVIGDKIGVFSLFPIMLSDIFFLWVIYAGFLMIACEIPLRKKGLTFEVIRMNRLSWFLGQIVYCFLMAVTYFSLLFILGNIFYIRNLDFTTHWGKAVIEGTAFTGELGMTYPAQILDMNAAKSCLAGFGLAVLLAMVMGMICCACNMFTQKGIGPTLCGVMLVAQIWADAWGISCRDKLPVGVLTAFFRDEGENLSFALGYYIVSIAILVIIGYCVLRKTDIKEE